MGCLKKIVLIVAKFIFRLETLEPSKRNKMMQRKNKMCLLDFCPRTVIADQELLLIISKQIVYK